MKRFAYIILTAIAILVSCSTYDHEAILEQLRDHEDRITIIEEQCRKLNSSLEALQTIMEALQKNDYVTSVTCIEESGREVGYKMNFAKSGEVTVYTIPDGTAPQLRVSEGYWYASFDDGVTWHQLGKVGEEAGQEPLFSDVTYDDEYVYLTLHDGNKIAIPTVKISYWFGKKMIWNGDSISYGSWLASPATDAYPYLVGNVLGMDTHNFAIGGSYAAKPKGSFEKYYWDYDEWMKAIENGDLDTSKKYLVKDYVNSKKPCRIYYFDGSQWKANSETGGWALVERVKEMVAIHPDADVIGIAIGTNDFYTGACPFGEIDAASYRNLEELRKQMTFDKSVNLVELGESIADMKLLKPEYTLAESSDFYVVLDIPITSGKKYQAASGYRSWFLDSEKQPLSTINLKDQDHIFTAPAGAHYISISFSGEIGSGAVFQENETDGSISEEEMTLTHSTFCGAIHTICKYLLDNYKNKDIVFITPIKRYQGWCKYPEDKNSLGYTLKDYSNAIIEICSYYSIPVIDFYSTSGLNPHIDTSLFGDTDGKAVHPNEEGHRRMASLVIGYLQNLRQ